MKLGQGAHVDRARSGAIAALKRMKGLKVVAAGKG